MQDFPEHGEVEPFKKYYDGSDPQWGHTSGPGSDPFYTADYRTLISKFIRLNAVNSVVEVGCGDWQFSRFIDFSGASYTGFDVVDSIIRSNLTRYQTDQIGFRLMPSELTDVPSANLLIMKDVLQHLSDEIINTFRTLVFPKFKHCLLTNSYRKLDTPQNLDIPTGEFRCLDLTKSPFSFPGIYLMEFGSTVWEYIRVFYYTDQAKF